MAPSWRASTAGTGACEPPLKPSILEPRRQTAGVGRGSRPTRDMRVGRSWRARTRALVHPLLEAKFAHLAIERRAADAKAPGDFRHVPAIAAERQADHVGLHRLERADFALIGDRLNAERALAPGRS